MPTVLVRIGRVGFMGLFPLAGIATEPASGPPGPKEAPPVVMESFSVEGNYVPKLSFGLSLNVWKDGNTRKVTSISVDRVRAGSEAEQKGLAPQVRILRINGKPVQEIDASFFKGTELNQVFVDRRNGEKVTLEIFVPGDATPVTIVLTEQHSSSKNFPGTMERFER